MPLADLRDSYGRHLAATKSARTRAIYLDALDRLAGFLETSDRPTGVAAISRADIEAFLIKRREVDRVKPATLSLEFRAIQQFWKWAAEEDEPASGMQTRFPTFPVHWGGWDHWVADTEDEHLGPHYHVADADTVPQSGCLRLTSLV